MPSTCCWLLPSSHLGTPHLSKSTASLSFSRPGLKCLDNRNRSGHHPRDDSGSDRCTCHPFISALDGLSPTILTRPWQSKQGAVLSTALLAVVHKTVSRAGHEHGLLGGDFALHSCRVKISWCQASVGL